MKKVPKGIIRTCGTFVLLNSFEFMRLVATCITYDKVSKCNFVS